MKATSAPKSDDARHLIWLRDELGDGFGSTPRQIAEKLAEAAAFAAVIVYQVLHTIDGVAEFVIECSSVHIPIRTLAPVPWPATRDDREGLALVRAAPSVVVNMDGAP